MKKEKYSSNADQDREFNIRKYFEAEEQTSHPSRKLLSITLSLVVILTLVVFLLPVSIQDSKDKLESGITIVDSGDQTIDKVTPAQANFQIDREFAQEALRKASDLSHELNDSNANLWAKSEFAQIKGEIDQGQAYYRAKHYSNAQRTFRDAERKAAKLLTQIPQLIENLLSEGRLALQTGDSHGATNAFEMVLKIRSQEPLALKGLRRAYTLDKVMSLVDQGSSYERMAELDKAKAAFKEALRLDPETTAALAAMQRLEDSEKERRYNKMMSNGFRLLEEKRFGESEKAFMAAYKIYRIRESPMRALAEVTSARISYNIATFEKKAQKAKKEEDWKKTHAFFSKILELDDSLIRAQKEKRKAAFRIKLEKKILRHLKETARLLNAEVYEEAKVILKTAKNETQRGEKLSSQIETLEKVIALSRSPITVLFRSDEETVVASGQIGNLGTFKTRSLKLNPGKYTATGRKEGFRDVRKIFSVRHDERPKVIEIICREKIFN